MQKINKSGHAFGHEGHAFLEEMLEKGCIDFLDLKLTDRFAGQHSEEVAAFFCHLVLATREGHLCIKVDEDGVTPPSQDLWKSEDVSEPSEDELTRLKDMILRGAFSAPKTLVSNCDSSKAAPIIRDGPFYYFHKSWNLKATFLNHLKALLGYPKPAIALDLKLIETKLSELQAQGKLLPSQAAAILRGCESTITVITGGPGTGKTHTAGMLLRILIEGCSCNLRSVALAAPTGKAAANLEASIARTLSDLTHLGSIKGQTLHQLLKINQKKYTREGTILSADIVIVDECSMIDADLMGKLLWSIKPGARLILLGDRDQLPSVEAGSLFADLTCLLNKGCHVTELKKCLRAESKEIVELLEDVRQGNVGLVAERFMDKTTSEAVICRKLSEALSPKDIQQDLLQHVLPFLKSNHFNQEDASELFADFNRYRILTPLRKGPFGSVALNAAIFFHMQNRNSQSLAVIPIMITKNDYRMGLFNGEAGLLIQYRENKASENYALFPLNGCNPRKISALLLPEYELAYCLSIHKAQGSEFDHVTLLLPEGSQKFGRMGFYTGASRAKKRLEIWSSMSVVSAMLERTGTRLSGLS